MKQLLEQIEAQLGAHQNGWCTLKKASMLSAAIVTLQPSLVCEVGVWAGRSFVPMALTLKKLGGGIAVGIDPWKAEESAKEMSGDHLEWWSKTDHEAIFNEFTKWISDLQLGQCTEIHRCRSDEFNHKAMIEKYGLIDFLHLDGNHGEKASVYDVKHYASNVRVGGLLFFDDVEWAKTAVSMLPGLGFRRLYFIEGGAVFQRLNYELSKL